VLCGGEARTFAHLEESSLCGDNVATTERVHQPHSEKKMGAVL
jgi:hypothetical protein